MKPLADEAAFLRGVQLHDDGAFWDAHEAWEGLWREARSEDTRLLLQGLIQVTAAFHKLLVQGDVDAALRLLDRGLEKLDRVAGDQDGVRVTAFREATRRCREAVARDGTAVDRAAIPRLEPRATA